MLIRVMRHGFEYWEAPRNLGLAMAEPSREVVRLAEVLDLDPEEVDRIWNGGRRPRTGGGRRSRGTRKVCSRPDRDSRVVKEIQRLVEAAFGVPERMVQAEGKGGEEIGLARTASMALCRLHTMRTAGEIGALHRRDHAAVLRAARRCDDLRATDREFAGKVAEIEAALARLEPERIFSTGA